LNRITLTAANKHQPILTIAANSVPSFPGFNLWFIGHLHIGSAAAVVAEPDKARHATIDRDSVIKGDRVDVTSHCVAGLRKAHHCARLQPPRAPLPSLYEDTDPQKETAAITDNDIFGIFEPLSRRAQLSTKQIAAFDHRYESKTRNRLTDLYHEEGKWLELLGEKLRFANSPSSMRCIVSERTPKNC
jgi:hypothetical protein